MIKKNKHWFVLNGQSTSGKDEVKKIINKHTCLKSISSVDDIKHICALLGWDKERNDAGRLALFEFKSLADKHFDYSFRYTKSSLESFMKDEEDVIFTVDVREPENIKRLFENLNFKTIFVSNNNVNHIPDNYADRNVSNYEYDYIIDNNGTLEDLERNVISFLDSILN